MPLREPAPIPVPFDLARFLASSLTFMVHLRSVSVMLDGRSFVSLSKTSGPRTDMQIPRILKTATPKGMMHVRGVGVMRKLEFCYCLPDGQ